MDTLMKNQMIKLRPLEPTDLDTLYNWENDTALWVVSDTVAPYSRAALWQYLEAYTGDIYAQRQLRLMITLASDDTPVGTIDFLNFDPLNNRAELGLFVDLKHRGKGLGRQALELLTDYAREHLGLRQLYVYIALDNEVCLNLFDTFGYHRVGVIKSWVKRGRTYRDVALMQMIL
jgi:diamine N-acetyltransferase